MQWHSLRLSLPPRPAQFLRAPSSGAASEKAYAEYAGAFAGVINAGASLASANMSLGAEGMGTDAAVKPLWATWGPVHEEYQASKARLDLVASPGTAAAAAVAHQFFATNILAAPPFTPGSSIGLAGEHAQQGPGPVARELTNQLDLFTAVARKDIVGRAWGRSA